MDKSIHINSFVIRFVQEGFSSDSSEYHGSIRHIQTDHEVSFNHWDEATNFIKNFVALEPVLTPHKKDLK